LDQKYPEELPVEGKTYSLFGNSESASHYYQLVRELADQLLMDHADMLVLLSVIRKYSNKKILLKRIVANSNRQDLLARILHLINSKLEVYTRNTPGHLRRIPIRKITDRRLRTSREQYHLYMLEIELTNRINRQNFRDARRRIALMPYCLQDFTVKCKSEKNGMDYQCRHCSKICFQNHASRLLEKHKVEPYIWMGSDLKKLAKMPHKDDSGTAVLGIACIPELVMGMRRCGKLGIPVVGIPLNANRCVRWFGEFHPNSVHLQELEALLEG